MLKFFLPAIALLIVACGSPEPYPEPARQAFIEGCAPSEEALPCCECVIGWYESRMSFEEFMEWSNSVDTEKDLPDETSKAATGACWEHFPVSERPSQEPFDDCSYRDTEYSKCRTSKYGGCECEVR